MAYGHQVKLAFGKIETVNHPIVADAQPELIQADHSMVRKCCQTQTHRINLLLDSRLNCRRHPKKIGIKFA